MLGLYAGAFLATSRSVSAQHLPTQCCFHVLPASGGCGRGVEGEGGGGLPGADLNSTQCRPSRVPGLKRISTEWRHD